MRGDPYTGPERRSKVRTEMERELLAELHKRNRQLGTIKVLLLQGDIEGALNEVVCEEVIYSNGYPSVKSAAIAKAEAPKTDYWDGDE